MDLSCVLKDSLTEARRQVAAYATGQAVDAVQLTRRGAPVFNSTTGLLTAPPTNIYTGPAKVTVVSGGDPVDIGEERQFWDTVSVQLPPGAPMAKIDDLVQITSAAATQLVGRYFRVASVAAGGLMPDGQTLSASGPAPSQTNPSVP